MDQFHCLNSYVGVGDLADIADQLLPGDDIPRPQSRKAEALGKRADDDDILIFGPQRHRRFLTGH